MGRIITGLQKAQRLWKIVLAIYFFQFVLAATVGLQMMQVIDASIGNSLSIRDLMKGYDYTVITDFLNHHGGSFTPLIGQMRWMVGMYLVFASFISAGVMYVLTMKSEDYLDFFKGGAKYFGRFFILDSVFTLIIVAILGLGFSLVGYLFSIAPTTFDTEIPFLQWTLFVLFCALMIIIVLIGAKTFIKIHYLSSDDSIIKSIKEGIGSVLTNVWRIIIYSMIFFLVSILLIYVNHQVGNLPLLIMILIQQTIIVFKILWRVTYYSVFVQLES